MRGSCHRRRRRASERLLRSTAHPPAIGSLPSDGLQANLRSFAQNTHGTRTLDQRRSGSAERVGVAVRLPSQQARVLERLSTLLRAGMHGWRHIVEAACDYGLVDLSDRRGRLAIRLATLVAGQLAMLALMFALLETYEPEPTASGSTRQPSSEASQC